MIAARVEGGVPRYEGGEFPGEELKVVVADFRVDLERAMPERGRASLARRPRRAIQRFLAVADAGQHGHAQHGRVKPSFAEPSERAEALTGRRGPGVRPPHDVLVDARDAEIDGEIGLPVELAQHVDVPDDQRTLRDDARRQRTLHERLETPARQAVLPLDRLVRIGRGTDRERTLAWLTKLVTKDVGDVDAHLDVAVEVRADVPLAVARVIRPCKAVGARMDAAEEWIEAPFERHAFDGVERAFDLDLAVRGSRHRSRPRNAS